MRAVDTCTDKATASAQQLPKPDQEPRLKLGAILRCRASAVFGRVRHTFGF